MVDTTLANMLGDITRVLSGCPTPGKQGAGRYGTVTIRTGSSCSDGLASKLQADCSDAVRAVSLNQAVAPFSEEDEDTLMALVLDDAIEAVREACRQHRRGVLDSTWTSGLTLQLRCSELKSYTEPIDESTTSSTSSSRILPAVLQSHGWTGLQFTSPPDSAALLDDLQCAADSLAAARSAPPRPRQRRFGGA